MGLRFRRSIRLIPGVHLNLSKSGPSLSVGRRGFTMNVGHGRVTRTIGIPGTGVSWRSDVTPHSRPAGRPHAGYGVLFVLLALVGLAIIGMVGR